MAAACGFHTYLPQPSFVDRLLSSDHVVLARQDLDDPFRFVAVQSLKGPHISFQLPHLVDSTTRRRFGKEPDARVLFARDAEDGNWARIAFVDTKMRPLLDDVFARLGDWSTGEENDRFQYFGRLINHEDQTIRRIALRELDQASYPVLKGLDLSPDPGMLASQLVTLNETDLAPIRVLLLGLSDTSDVSDLLQSGVERNRHGGSALLGAYTAAWIEHVGPTAARIVAQDYLIDPLLPLDSREMMFEALALHAEAGDPNLRRIVHTTVDDVVRARPQLAPAAARQFGSRQDWSLHGSIREVLQSGELSSPVDIITVAQYVALAENAGANSGN